MALINFNIVESVVSMLKSVKRNNKLIKNANFHDLRTQALLKRGQEQSKLRTINLPQYTLRKICADDETQSRTTQINPAQM